MSQFIELAIDAVGLACGTTSWVMITIGAFVGFAMRFWRPEITITLAAVIGVFVVLLGFFLKWIANGILNRKRLRMIFLSVGFLLMGVPQILHSSMLPAAAGESNATWYFRGFIYCVRED